ncbi:MAG: hypothetical protein JXM70_16985 [Pirellulales bacterium]|nr:hypothetical protein [Pirellulales bacterium]
MNTNNSNQLPWQHEHSFGQDRRKPGEMRTFVVVLLTAVLLDHRAPADIENAIRESIETDGDRLADLHVWSIGTGLYCAVISVISDTPRQPQHYKSLLP